METPQYQYPNHENPHKITKYSINQTPNQKDLLRINRKMADFYQLAKNIYHPINEIHA
jgi:hypothetical protein